jgi:type VI secretion system protein ImpM
MSGIVTAHRVIAGFYGKMPARGDFVRAALPRDFTDPWDEWMQTMIAGSRALMGDDWLPAYLEAPIWRFTLPAGWCGAHAVMGLMLPSVDKAGRYFPLTFAALGHGQAITADEAWLDRAEEAGLDALEHDTDPDGVSLMLGEPPIPHAAGGEEGVGVWWTSGSPRVEASRLTLTSMPDVPAFALMLGARTADANIPPGEHVAQDVSWEVPS